MRLNIFLFKCFVKNLLLKSIPLFFDEYVEHSDVLFKQVYWKNSIQFVFHSLQEGINSYHVHCFSCSLNILDLQDQRKQQSKKILNQSDWRILTHNYFHNLSLRRSQFEKNSEILVVKQKFTGKIHEFIKFCNNHFKFQNQLCYVV